MTLLDRILERGYEMPLDPIIASRIERHMQRIKPDPLFQRRLRGQVVNRYVATREGMVAATRPVRLPRRSLSVLGRGMLYASLLTAVSATAVGAAAQQSLPGDMLYGVKLELESIRMELAPASMRDDLAAMALDERLDEVEALAAAGRWSQVERGGGGRRASAGHARRPDRGRHDGGSAAGAVDLPEHVDRLAELISMAPDAEKRGLLRALAASGGSPSDVHSNRDQRDRESRAAQGTAWRSGRARCDRHATSSRPRSPPRRRRRPPRQPRSRTSRPRSAVGSRAAGPAGRRTPSPRAARRKGNASGALAAQSPSATTENGVEANLYPVPARGAG